MSNATSETRRAFVLVHGAWHGGWCWHRVAARLRAAGHTVYTPTLTGLADRSHLIDRRIDLQTHVTDVVNLLKWESLHDVILVGHSYGGTVISAVAEERYQALEALVFLDAFLPESGQSQAELGSPAIRDKIAAAVASGAHTIAPPAAAQFRVNAQDRALVDALCTPHPLATLTARPLLTGARDRVPVRAYIRAADYPNPTFDGHFAALQGRPGWHTYAVPCGHDVMLDMPDRLTEILCEVAAARGGI